MGGGHLKFRRLGESRTADCPWCCCCGTGNAGNTGGGVLALISPSEGEANECRQFLSQMKK
ncbi:hypothetical protein ACLK1T_13870 [Escherichia coli]